MTMHLRRKMESQERGSEEGVKCPTSYSMIDALRRETKRLTPPPFPSFRNASQTVMANL